MAYDVRVSPINQATPRIADYDRANKIADKWRMSEDQTPFGCANLESFMRMKDGQFFWSDRMDWSPENKHFYETIRTSDLMYRVACTFEGHIAVYGQAGYKAVWHVCLTHRKTGVRIGLGEHKGAASWWSGYYDFDMAKKDAGEEFLDDILDLFQYLVDDQCAHPYDGLVACSIA